MLLVILHRIHAVEWKGRIETCEHGRLSHLRNFRRHLVGEKVTAQSRLCSLSILELDNRCVLYRLFSDAEHACGNLRNCQGSSTSQLYERRQSYRSWRSGAS